MRVSTPISLMAVALMLGSCAGEPPSGGHSVSTEPVPDAPVSDVFDPGMRTVDGGTLDTSTVTGPVVLWFWAPWCVICRAEAPHMAELNAELVASESTVTFVGVAGRGDLSGMQGFVADTGVESMNHIADVEGVLWSQFGIISQPALVFISADGDVDVVNGVLGQDQIRDTIDTLEGA